MANDYTLHGRFWIEGPEGAFLGPGRVKLLERILEHGSITAAARSMEMSYRHAWRLVDSMNRQSKRPVVERKTGGRGGGGTIVTEEGKRAIELFRESSRDLKSYLGKKSAKLNF
ncbi:MAG: LysR family transcriptional regulator [Gammaproteobacteria bacterium]|nr:LysR family transcriptional regulator [Gammaproteobacteria bacterium]